MTEIVGAEPPAEFAQFVLRDIVTELGVVGLLPAAIVDNLLNANAHQLDPVAKRLMTHAQYLSALIRQSSPPHQEVDREKEEKSPINTPTRRFLSTLISVESTNKPFWHTAAIRQGQAMAFGEAAIHDYTRFQNYSRGSEERLEGIRLYMSGMPSLEIQDRLGVSSTLVLSVFRNRFCRRLHENHNDGFYTLRRQLLEHLDATQADSVRVNFPAFLAREAEDLV